MDIEELKNRVKKNVYELKKYLIILFFFKQIKIMKNKDKKFENSKKVKKFSERIAIFFMEEKRGMMILQERS